MAEKQRGRPPHSIEALYPRAVGLLTTSDDPESIALKARLTRKQQDAVWLYLDEGSTPKIAMHGVEETTIDSNSSANIGRLIHVGFRKIEKLTR